MNSIQESRVCFRSRWNTEHCHLKDTFLRDRLMEALLVFDETRNPFLASLTKFFLETSVSVYWW